MDRQYRTGADGRTRRRTAAVVACGVLVVAGHLGAAAVPLAGPAAAVAPAPAKLSPAVFALARDWHVSTYEAAARIGRQDEVDMLAERLAVGHPDAFGGLWIDHANGGRVVVATLTPGITGPAAAGLGLDDLITERPAVHPLTRLQALSDEVGGAILSLPEAAKGAVTSYIDVPTNRIVVTVAPGRGDSTPERVLAASLAERYGAALTVRSGAATQDDACYTSSCPPPLRGSVLIKRTGSRCTAGFVVRSRSDAKPYILTAGHCGHGTWTHYFYGLDHTIGTTHRSRDSGNVDAQLIPINNVPGWAPRNWVIHGAFADLPRDESFSITSVASNSQQTTGYYLCRTGFQTGTQCGAIVAPGASRGNNTGLVGIRACAEPGDSGGPVYEPETHRAFGLHVSSSDSTPCNAQEISYYSPIGAIQDALNVNVLTR
jgi:streptogrisin B